jgi:predicted NAD/FAD-dependent oxidoreductase
VAILVLGAGIAGLSCARALADGGAEVRVIEKSSSLGGRVAARILGGAPFAYGTPDLSALGQPRADARAWIGRLAEGLAVDHGRRATSVVPTGAGATVTFEDGSSLTADCVVVSFPAPQAVAVLGPALAGPLASVRYTRTVVGAWRTPLADDIDRIPASPLIARVVQRGPVRVAHVRPDPSEARWDDPEEVWLASMEDELGRLRLPTAGYARFLKRWRFSCCKSPLCAPFWRATPAILACGDAFAPEGHPPSTTAAARASGLAAAASLLAEGRPLREASPVGT